MNTFRTTYLPLDFRILQILYALRLCWWGIGAYSGWTFAVPYLDYLREPMTAFLMSFAGLCGLTAAWRSWFYISYIFHILSVFIFGMISFSFFRHDPAAVAGVNYFIEMLGPVWLTVRIQTLCKFSYESHIQEKALAQAYLHFQDVEKEETKSEGTRCNG